MLCHASRVKRIFPEEENFHSRNIRLSSLFLWDHRSRYCNLSQQMLSLFLKVDFCYGLFTKMPKKKKRFVKLTSTISSLMKKLPKCIACSILTKFAIESQVFVQLHLNRSNINAWYCGYGTETCSSQIHNPCSKDCKSPRATPENLGSARKKMRGREQTGGVDPAAQISEFSRSWGRGRKGS